MIIKYLDKYENSQIKKYKLWEICNFDRRFNGVTKEKQKTILNFKHISAKELREYTNEESGNVRLLSTGNYEGYTNLNLEDKNLNKGEVITIPTGGTASIKYHNGYFIDSGNILFSSSDDSKYNTKYIYYYLLEINYKVQLFFRGAGVQHPSMPDIIEFDIAIPPIDVQNEIVEVLDKFTELEAELEARTKQFEYYQKSLLGFKENKNIKWIKIEDLFNIRNGYTPSTKNSRFWENGTIPWFRMEDIRTNGRLLSDSIRKITKEAVKGKLFEPNSIIISTSATIGEYALINVPYLSNQRFTNLSLKEEFKDDLDMMFMYHYMYVVSEWCKKNITESSFASVDMASFRKLQIPIPPLEEQDYIVSILDKFSSLVNDIKEGLPAEIELRRKQYEYYRNKLLTFE